MPRDHAEPDHLAKLRLRQRKFVMEYVACGNAAEAARRAGYSEHTAREIGTENLSKPHIAYAVKVEAEKAAQAVEVTREMVLEGLRKEAMLEGEGSSQSGRVAAWSTLSKCLGMQTHKVEADHRGQMNHTVTSSSINELLDDDGDPDA